MFSYSQDKQTSLVNSNLRSLEHQGNFHRSQERLIQSLSRLPIYWKLVPCIGKRPLGRKWQDNYYSPQALFRSLSQFGKVWVKSKRGLCSVVPNGYSLLCGHQVGGRYLIAIDCDSYEALNRFEQMRFPTTVSYSSDRPGHKQYLYYVDRPIKSFKLANGLEIRGRNLLSTLPPSTHPMTGKYRWLTAPDLYEIPTLSSLWLNYLRPQPKMKSVEARVSSNKTVEELIMPLILFMQISMMTGLEWVWL